MRSSFSFLSLVVFSSVFHVIYAGPHDRIAKREEPKVAAAWYGGWTATAKPSVPISSISFGKYTHLIYAFAETTRDNNLDMSKSNPHLLTEFVTQAKAHGVKVSVAIGGWAGSRYFSSTLGSAKNRTAFVKTVTSFAHQHQLDGLDFDWEHPGKQGIGCNTVSPHDSDNFLAFLQELRHDPVGAKLILSAAGSTTTFVSSSGSPSSNLGQFGKVLDRLTIMNYDIFGPWSDVVGPNSPIDDKCASPAHQQGSAVSAVKAWRSAGIPLSKLVLGVPTYGHSSKVNPTSAFHGTSLAAYPPFNKAVHVQGDSWSSVAGVDQCGKPAAPGDTVNFWSLVAQGYLKDDGTPGKDIAYRFDSCSRTAYVYDKAKQVMVSFDDAKSFAAKGKFIKDAKIAGFSMWLAGGDHKDILLDSIRKAGGFPQKN